MKFATYFFVLLIYCLIGCAFNQNTSNTMNHSSELTSIISNFIHKIDSIESSDFDLGRPGIVRVPEMEAVTNLGEIAIPALLSYLNEDKPKQVAYLVYTIALIDKKGESKKVIISMREKLSKHQKKTEWDYAAIGECNLFLASLSGE